MQEVTSSGGYSHTQWYCGICGQPLCYDRDSGQTAPSLVCPAHGKVHTMRSEPPVDMCPHCNGTGRVPAERSDDGN